jgi:hypothetical protein
VQVYVLVTEDTFEEKLLTTLSGQHQLALAALDMDSDVDQVALVSGIDELKRRLEVLLGAKKDAAIDESERRRQEEETERLQRRTRVAEAGGQLLGAALAFLSEMIPPSPESDVAARATDEFRTRLEECLERDDAGRPKLTVTLPDDAVLDRLAASLGSLLAGARTAAGGDGAGGFPEIRGSAGAGR